MDHYFHGTSRIFYEVNGSGDPVLVLPGFSERTTDHAAMLDILMRFALDLTRCLSLIIPLRSFFAGRCEE